MKLLQLLNFATCKPNKTHYSFSQSRSTEHESAIQSELLQPKRQSLYAKQHTPFFFFKPGASLWKRVILLLIAITNWDLIKRQLGLAYFRKGLIKKQKKRKSTQCNKQEIIPCSSLHLWLQALAVICNTAHDPRESWRCMPIHFFPL